MNASSLTLEKNDKEEIFEISREEFTGYLLRKASNKQVNILLPYIYSKSLFISILMIVIILNSHILMFNYLSSNYMIPFKHVFFPWVVQKICWNQTIIYSMLFLLKLVKNQSVNKKNQFKNY